MANFDTLKQMDIQEIHRKTRITLVRLQDIIEKRFDNIDPTRAHGFIKILERELQLDLSDWIAEYDAYKQPKPPKDTESTQANTQQIATPQNTAKQENNQSAATKPQANTQPPKPTTKQAPSKKKQLSGMNIEISMPNQQTSSKAFLIVIVMLGVVALVAFGIYFTNTSNTHEKQATQENDTQKVALEKEINQTYPTISLHDALNDTEQKRVKADSQKQEAQAPQQEITKQSQANQESPTKQETSTKQEAAQNQSMPQEVTSAQEAKTQQSASQITMTITPKRDVWFAWVDTITKVRKDTYTKKPITITISNPTAFHFGNAILDIEINGEVLEYNYKSVAYMLYDKEQGMKMITQKEYNALRGR